MIDLALFACGHVQSESGDTLRSFCNFKVSIQKENMNCTFHDVSKFQTLIHGRHQKGEEAKQALKLKEALENPEQAEVNVDGEIDDEDKITESEEAGGNRTVSNSQFPFLHNPIQDASKRNPERNILG